MNVEFVYNWTDGTARITAKLTINVIVVLIKQNTYRIKMISYFIYLRIILLTIRDFWSLLLTCNSIFWAKNCGNFEQEF